MNLFPSRHDHEYRKLLLERFQFEGKNGLINTAIEDIDPEFPDFTKICRIDQCGIAATTLFDRNAYYNDSTIANQLYSVLQNVNILNEKGIRLVIRLLFLYPYSEASITRIQAEMQHKRGTMETPKFDRAFDYIQDVTPTAFKQSTICMNQMRSLTIIQDYLKEFKLLDEGSPNRIIIRFSPFGLNTCCLFINQTLFFDSYTLAKEKKTHGHLISISPLIMIDKNNVTESPEDKENEIKVLSGYQDHFGYLWQLDSTLFCEDATWFNKENYTGLTEIKGPLEVTYEQKANIIKNYNHPEYNSLSVDKKTELENDWKFKMGFALRKLTVNLREIPSKEKLFIACSWHRNQGNRTPNHFAVKLKEWLNLDFGNIQHPCMNVDFVLTPSGDNVYERLYHDLQDATLAIILLTKDIKGKGKAFHPRPNLSHELGYLIKQLEGTKRVFIYYQEGVEVISNVEHIAHKTFNDANFEQNYIDAVLDWLKNSGCYLNKTYLDKAFLRQRLIIDELPLH